MWETKGGDEINLKVQLQLIIMNYNTISIAAKICIPCVTMTVLMRAKQKQETLTSPKEGVVREDRKDPPGNTPNATPKT